MSEQVTWKLDENTSLSVIPETTVVIYQPNGEVVATICGQITLPEIAGSLVSDEPIIVSRK